MHSAMLAAMPKHDQRKRCLRHRTRLNLVERQDVRQREIRIDRPDRLLELAQKARRADACRTHRVGHRAPAIGLIQHRPVRDRRRWLIQPIVTLVADHTHNLAPRRSRVRPNALPERSRGLAPVLTRQR